MPPKKTIEIILLYNIHKSIIRTTPTYFYLLFFILNFNTCNASNKVGFATLFTAVITHNYIAICSHHIKIKFTDNIISLMTKYCIEKKIRRCYVKNTGAYDNDIIRSTVNHDKSENSNWKHEILSGKITSENINKLIAKRIKKNLKTKYDPIPATYNEIYDIERSSPYENYFSAFEEWCGKRQESLDTPPEYTQERDTLVLHKIIFTPQKKLHE